MAASFCSMPAGVAGHRSRSARSQSPLGQRTLRPAAWQGVLYVLASLGLGLAAFGLGWWWARG
jgi:hypothetical protein